MPQGWIPTTDRVALPRLHSSHAVTRLWAAVAPPATRGTTWSIWRTTPGALPGRPQYLQRKPSRCRTSNRSRAGTASRARGTRPVIGESARTASRFGPRRLRGPPARWMVDGLAVVASRVHGGPTCDGWNSRLKVRVNLMPSLRRSVAGRDLLATPPRVDTLVTRTTATRTRPNGSPPTQPSTSANSPIDPASIPIPTTKPRQPRQPFTPNPSWSLGLPLGAVDPGEEYRPPPSPVKGLLEVGGRAQQHQIVGRASASDAQPSRGTDMVDLEPAKTVVGDPEAAEDTAAITGPDMLTHDRRDRIPRFEDPSPPPTRVAPQHRRTASWSYGLRQPRRPSSPAGLAPR